MHNPYSFSVFQKGRPGDEDNHRLAFHVTLTESNLDDEKARALYEKARAGFEASGFTVKPLRHTSVPNPVRRAV